MANEVAAQAGTRGLAFQVPASLAARLKAAAASNIPTRETTNQLTFSKGEWTVSVNGESKVLQRANEDGELENILTLKAVVVDWAKTRGRSYYRKKLVPGMAASRPDCFSNDGRKPSPTVEEPVHGSCETCPMAAMGSRVSEDGKEMIACEQYRFLAVALSPTAPILRLRIKQTSEYDMRDDESRAAGWYGWKQYTEHLRANGLDFTGAVITKIRFAPKVEWAKLQFAMGTFLEDDMAMKMVERAQSEEVVNLIAGYSDTAPPRAATAKAAGKPLPKDDNEPTAEQLAADAARAVEAKAAAQAEAQKVADAAAKEAAKKAKAEKAAKAEAARIAAEEAAAKAKAAANDDDGFASPFDDGDEPKPAVTRAESADAPPRREPKAAPEAATSAALVEVPAALAGILGAWGD